ncbi:hypothetical protein H7J86_24725 [Mycobacterium hackensackense]|uniref:cyclophilin-like fold protein n=1 Tax=Mycobacterium hackensackense TaxID=228909 RepID=UPI0022658FBF|nr:cyclophilin-like fold protein [Mycobacterium hackensackense]MCV7255372.1 hypothetical protein [Mycobacterium hackensackense]
MRLHRWACVLAPLVIATACAAAEDPSPASAETTTRIEIVVAGQRVSAHLADNPTARDLAAQLPLELTFRDLNNVEKIAPLPRALTTDGVPPGADPEIADIGYYAPTQELVLYYGDVGYWAGIVRIGGFDPNQLALIAGQRDGVAVTVGYSNPANS